MASDRALTRVLWGAAGVALAAGVLLTVRTLLDLPRLVERHARRVQDSRAVAALLETRREQEAAISCWTRLETAAPPLAEVLGSRYPEAVAGVRGLDPVAGPTGWQVRRAAVSLTGLAYDRIAGLERAAAASRPPWVLAECLVEASDRAGIAARVELTFETAERVTK